MKQYEITFIVPENYNEDKAKSIAKEVRELIESKGAKIEKDVFWGKRKLAFKIAKNTFGYYFVYVFSMEPSKVNDINRDLNLDEKIIRYIVGDYIENTSFFEEVGTKKKEGERKPFGDARDRPNKKVKKTEETVEAIEEKPEIPETGETVEIPEEEIEKEIEEIEPIEEKEPKEEKIEEEVEEKIEEPEEKIEEIPEPKEEPAEKKEEVKEEKEDEGKPTKKKTLTDDERKAQLDAKLAELLKDEE